MRPTRVHAHDMYAYDAMRSHTESGEYCSTDLSASSAGRVTLFPRSCLQSWCALCPTISSPSFCFQLLGNRAERALRLVARIWSPPTGYCAAVRARAPRCVRNSATVPENSNMVSFASDCVAVHTCASSWPLACASPFGHVCSQLESSRAPSASPLQPKPKHFSVSW